jgi:hypothetical protein
MSLSNIALQVFKHLRGEQFSAITQTTAIFNTLHFLLLPPQNFLTLLVSQPNTTSTSTGLLLGPEDFAIFGKLQHAISDFRQAVGELSKKDTT